MKDGGGLGPLLYATVMLHFAFPSNLLGNESMEVHNTRTVDNIMNTSMFEFQMETTGLTNYTLHNNNMNNWTYGESF